MRLSFYTYSYTDRGNLPISDCLRRIAKTGYAGIDESGTFGASADPKSVSSERRTQIRETAAREKLRVEAVVTHAELTSSLVTETPLDLHGSIDLAVDLGAPVVTFHMGGPVKGLSEKDLWWKTVGILKAAANYGAARHVALAIDLGIWPEWITSTPDLLAKMFNDVDVPTFGVNFDPCYLVVMGQDPVRFIKRFGPRIRHAHVKDHKGKFPRYDHFIPGKGDMNYVPIFAALAEAEFAGSLAVECFVDMKFEEACDQGYAALAASAREAGVKLM